ncbi:MAG TPA: radical SAM protein, partial [Tepidisphaeraceae bacterium]|nr:radical SAM protein [Tepidisphaeraceae bacterium]
EQIMLEAKELAADGAVELNLIGQDTTSYGTDIGYGAGLSGLLKTLDRKLDADVRWVRLMYAYPSCFTDEMIKTIAEASRVVKYIDMPLQHINDQMLTSMKRRVTRREIEILLEKLRNWVPGIAIRTTFIAGSPGETQQQHQELVKFVREFGFEMMGVFAYSQEPGTPMGKMDGQLPDEVKQEWVKELMLAQQEVAFAKARAMKGKKIEVLVDRPADQEEDKWVARATFQAPEIDSMTVVKAERLYPGQILEVSVSGAEGYDLVAQLPKRTSRSLKVVGATSSTHAM